MQIGHARFKPIRMLIRIWAKSVYKEWNYMQGIEFY
jgi:hypothetical protein